jgi:bacteriocin-like protein
MNQQSDMNLNSAIELSDAELMQIQGGNIFGDAWNAVTHAASDVVHAVTNAVTHPLDTLQKVASGIEWLAKHWPQPKPGPHL